MKRINLSLYQLTEEVQTQVKEILFEKLTLELIDGRFNNRLADIDIARLKAFKKKLTRDELADFELIRHFIISEPGIRNAILHAIEYTFKTFTFNILREEGEMS